MSDRWNDRYGNKWRNRWHTFIPPEKRGRDFGSPEVGWGWPEIEDLEGTL